MTSFEQGLAVAFWLVPLTAALAVAVIGFSEIHRQNKVHEAANPSASEHDANAPSFLVPLFFGLWLGALASAAWTCGPWTTFGAWSWGIAALGGFAVIGGGIMMWSRQPGAKVMIWASVLVLLGSLLVALVAMSKEACERAEQPAPIATSVQKRFGDLPPVRDATRWMVQGGILAHAAADRMTRFAGVRLMDAPLGSFDAMAKRAAEHTTAFGVFFVVGFGFMLLFPIVGLRHWMSRSHVRRVIGVFLLVPSLLVFLPTGTGLIGLAVPGLLLPDAALSVWLTALAMGLAGVIVIVTWVARSSRRLASDDASFRAGSTIGS